ncbi:uncharacterized protein EV420DRAFT_1646764 [Desarmillaria tabescens]|uniref:F-box domain-containing protein n=1 Tax=Armillaria tabescens TaxID=1929756 RepID=A0AA39JVM9_ARMTA|nr:uncharacterized protein EV420DRAFT_1646764 [Desarmillaria tabescens]KAK0449766.1 hypothetical protein EV420DRAFT_1646764 [Desarmillaria tabescens]
MLHLDAVTHSVPEPVFPHKDLNSRVSGLLRATRPLLDTDNDWIIPNIEDLQQQVSVYDTLLDRIDEIRSKVQSHRDAVQKSLADYASTLAPIRRLPNDVLRSLFREIQVSEWRNTGTPGAGWHGMVDFSQGPWTLSHVCGAWRDIVLSYPQLWSHIVLCFVTPRLKGMSERRSSPRHMADALKAMIHRSEQHPLDIVFLDFRSDIDEDTPVQALSVIAQKSYRWRTLQLCAFLIVLLERLKVVRGKIPCLESLTMDTSRRPQLHRADLHEDTRSIFVDAPRLQRVTLRGTRGLGDFVFPPHITQLAACITSVSNLGVYQSLIELHLELSQRDNKDISLPLNIHLPNVRMNRSNSDHGASTHNVQIVNDFIRRSRCSLSRLSFHSSNADDHNVIRESLLFMDTLVSLQIGGLWNIDVIFDVLASVGFLPNLQHLRLFCIGISGSSSLDSLVAMISSRSKHLRSVKIQCGRPEDVETFNRYLTALQQPGQHFIATERLKDGISGTQFGNFNRSDLDVLVDHWR